MGVEPYLREVNEPQSDIHIIYRIRELTQEDKGLQTWLSSATTGARQLSIVDGIVYNNGLIEELQYAIVCSRHDPKVAGHPRRAKTLVLVNRCLTWPSVKLFVNHYVDGCDSCQRTKPLTLLPLGTLEPLPIPAEPWSNISYDMITDLPPSNGYDSILTVIDWLTKMGHFVACRKNISADQLADLLIRYVWRLHGTPKTIVLDRVSVFTLQITRELNKRLGISLHPSTANHPCTEGQSEIANKVVEQYLHHYVRYRQDNWEELLATAKFAYNNNNHAVVFQT
jgi:hypothetical protein